MSTIGFDIDDLIDLDDLIASRSAERINAWLESMPSQEPESPESLWGRIESPLVSGIRNALVFDAETLLRSVDPNRRQRLTAAITRLALVPPVARVDGYYASLDRNPLRDRPVLRNGDELLVPVPGFLSRGLESLIEADALSKPSFSKHRASVLDDLATTFISQALGGAESYTALRYRDPDDPTIVYEMDGLVLYDDIAIVVEGKASKITTPARTGSLKRLARDVDNAVRAAMRQAQRDKEYILGPAGTSFLDERGLRPCACRPAGSSRCTWCCLLCTVLGLSRFPSTTWHTSEWG